MRSVVTLVVCCLSAAPAFGADCTADAAYRGATVITRGGSYTGNWESTDPAVPALQIQTTEPVTILHSRLRGPGDLVLATHTRSNVTVRESCFAGTYPTRPGTGRGRAIALRQPANVVIEHNTFESTGGYMQGWTTAGATVAIWGYAGDFTTDNSVKVRFNRFRNIDMRFSDGAGGYLTDRTSQWSIGISLWEVRDVPGIEVSWNEFIHEPFKGSIGDTININDTRGTPDSPALIHDNYVQGGWDSDPRKGSEFSYFGSAITTDGAYHTDPALTAAFIKIYENQAVGFGNLGISISIGHDIEMFHNRAISDGLLDDGTPAATRYSIGIQHMNWRRNPSHVFFNTSVHDNLAGVKTIRDGQWFRFDYHFDVPPTVNQRNERWFPTGTSAPTLADEQKEWLYWQEKLTRAQVRIGASPEPASSLRRD
jgi:hypothetical protein